MGVAHTICINDNKCDRTGEREMNVVQAKQSIYQSDVQDVQYENPKKLNFIESFGKIVSLEMLR